MFGPNLETFGSVSVAVKENLASIKDVLDTFSRKDARDVSELVPIVGLLQQVADTLGLLGLGIPRRSILEQRELLEELIEHERAPTNDQLMDIAGALLGVDATMDALSEQGVEKTIEDEQTAAEQDPTDSHLTGIEYLQLVTSVIGEIKTDLAIVKDAIATFLEDPAQRHRLDEVPRRVEQVVGGMRMLYLEPAADLMEHWLAFVDQVLLRASGTPGSDVLEPLAEGIEALEFYLESVANARADADDRLDDAEHRIRALPLADSTKETPGAEGTTDGGMFDVSNFGSDGESSVLSVRDDIHELSARMAAASGTNGEGAPSPTEPGVRADETADEDVAALQPDEAIDVAPSRVDPNAETVVNVELPESVARTLESARDTLKRMDGDAPVDDASGEGGVSAATSDEEVAALDPEIVEIFLEEAQEVLDELADTWPKWSADLADSEALAQVRRSFHTLKGSGRMAGAMTIGEFCWSIENMLNRVIDGVIPASGAVVAMVGEACQAVPRLLDELRGNGPSGVDVSGMAARAEALAEATASRVGAYTMPPGAGTLPTPSANTDADEPDTSTHVGDTVVLGPSGAEILEFPIRREPPAEALPPVVALFRDESSSHLDQIEALLAADASREHRLPSEYVRAVHTIVGGARSAGMDRVAAAGAAVEEYLTTLTQTQMLLSGDGVSLLRDALAWLREVPGSSPRGRRRRCRVRDRARAARARARRDRAGRCAQP